MKPAPAIALCTFLGLSATILSCKSAPPTPPTPPQPVTAPAPLTPKPNLDGIYSDMKVIPGEGDVIGVEVTIANSQSSPTVTFQCAQGELSKPQFIAAEITGTSVHFKTRDSSQCPGATYTGLIGNDTITLSQDGSSTPAEVLKHVPKPGARP